MTNDVQKSSVQDAQENVTTAKKTDNLLQRTPPPTRPVYGGSCANLPYTIKLPDEGIWGD